MKALNDLAIEENKLTSNTSKSELKINNIRNLDLFLKVLPFVQIWSLREIQKPE